MRDEAWAVLASALMVLTGAPAALAGSSGQAEQVPRPGLEAGPFGPARAAAAFDGPPTGPSQGEDLQDTLLVPTTTGTAEEPGRQSAWNVEVGPDGSVAALGTDRAASQPYLALFEPTGDLEWARTLDTGLDRAWGSGVAIGHDGALYVVATGSDQDPRALGSSLFKLDPSGDVAWHKALDREDPDRWFWLGGVAVDATQGVAAIGALSETYPGIEDAQVEIRTFEKDGTHRWTASSSAMPVSVGLAGVFDAAGRLHVAGHSYDANPGTHWRTWDNDPQYWRFDTDGSEEISLNLGEQGPRERAYSVAVSATGEVYLGGVRANSDWNDPRPLVARLGPLGTVDHVTEIDATSWGYGSIGVKASGTVVAEGSGQVDAFDGDGNRLWSRQDVVPEMAGEHVRGSALGPADRIHVAGTVTASDTGQDAFVASLADAYSPAAQVEQALAPGPLG